jgi:predicted CopG family antitoxin
MNTVNFMAHKTLTISEEAYDALAALKKEGESFTELIKRITSPLRKKKLSEFAGMIKDEKFAKAVLEVRHHPSRYSSKKRGKL